MNRIIKFKVWHKKKKVFVEVLQMSHNEEGIFGLIIVYPNENTDSLVFIEEVVLLQYTGLKDKNGKEIYEGDILNSKNDDPEYDIWGYADHDNKIVEWDNIHSCFTGVPDTDKNSVHSIEFIEVIGNIYENPNMNTSAFRQE